jgi:hypothetical protein
MLLLKWLFLSCSLQESTYSVEEVQQILSDLQQLLSSEVDRELATTSHVNVALMLQYFQQAEQWHVTLSSDIQQLDNRYVRMLFINLVV